MKHEWKIGEVTIAVEAPESMRIESCMLMVRPPDRAHFLSDADALGGLRALEMPQTDRGYHDYATVRVEGGGTVLLYEPPREGSPPARPSHPFFGPLAERVEREAT